MKIGLLTVFLFTILSIPVATSAQTYPVTVQGVLKDGAGPANGLYDIRCVLWGAETGGLSYGSQQFIGVQVTNGLYNVSITNVGSTLLFPPAELWIEFSVKPAGAGQYTILAPRQRMSYAPLAVHSVTADRLGGVLSTDFVQTNDPRLTDARPPLGGSGAYIHNTIGVQAANFNISGTGVAGALDALNEYRLGNVKLLSNGGNINNIYLGSESGFAGPTGSGNSFFGTQAGRGTTVGNNNSFFGFTAGRNNFSGVNNSFFGSSAGSANTSASSNSFFGSQSGASTTTGGFNTAFGYGSLFSNTTGVNNVMIGSNAGSNISTGSQNTFVGVSAGPTASAQSFNTLLGAGSEIFGGVNNSTAIGARAQVMQSNSMVLGAINGVNGATADTNVGIGTTSPASKLHVNGNVRVTNGGIFITNPNTLIITSPNGACWGITVNNSGALSTFPATCP